MLTPSFVNILSFFYPIGNTPAVNLAHDLPPGQSADILLLGCGDARNILCTTYHDGGSTPRELDITFCDQEKAVLARNILLFTMVLEDDKYENSSLIWNIYYHLFLDQNSFDMLQTQCRKLIAFAKSEEERIDSPYGTLIKFCDQTTLRMIKGTWETYLIADMTLNERTSYDKAFKAGIKKALETGTSLVGTSGPVITAVRSAAPTCLYALAETSELHQHFWDTGTTGDTCATESNPTFVSSGVETFNLHYGTDPLLGLHLATGYAPLTHDSPLRLDNDSVKKAVASARSQFRAWTCSFQKRAHHGLTLRFCSSDAISLCYKLQHKRLLSGNGSGNWYRGQYQSDILDLDSKDYMKPVIAPLLFDIIDTSNVADHVGSINILVAASQLLKNNLHAGLYTESLVKTENSHKELMEGFLCGDLPTISTLLGLISLEYWMNASAISNAEEIMINRTTRQSSGFPIWVRCSVGFCGRETPQSLRVLMTT